MKHQDILDAAIRMIGESDANGNTSDYTERAPYLLATFCSQALRLDQKYRKSIGETVEKKQIPASVLPEDPFPLSDVFVPAAIYYLAAMLILEENEDISKTLFEHSNDVLEDIRADLFARRYTIQNKYPLA